MIPDPAQKFSCPGTLKSYTSWVAGTSSSLMIVSQTRSPTRRALTRCWTPPSQSSGFHGFTLASVKRQNGCPRSPVRWRNVELDRPTEGSRPNRPRATTRSSLRSVDLVENSCRTPSSSFSPECTPLPSRYPSITHLRRASGKPSTQPGSRWGPAWKPRWSRRSNSSFECAAIAAPRAPLGLARATCRFRSRWRILAARSRVAPSQRKPMKTLPRPSTLGDVEAEQPEQLVGKFHESREDGGLATGSQADARPLRDREAERSQRTER